MKTVLVIDDSDIVLEITRKALEGAGYRVITRNRPSGSVAAILREKPDVVLLDLNMPTLAGDTIAKILAKVTQNPDMMVLLHSSMSIDNLRLKSIASGAQGYIQKTDSPTELVRRVEYWLNRHRLASSSRLEAATAQESSGSRDAPSSGRFEAAPSVSMPRASSSGRTPAAAPAPASSASSSSRLRAAGAYSPPPAVAQAVGAPPFSPSSGSFKAASPATSQSSAMKSAPIASSPSSAMRAAANVMPPSSASAGAPSSRNQRFAKGGPTVGEKVPRVLFVDDDWTMLNSYRMMVAGYLDGDFVSSSDDAFNRILSDSPPEVIVCDVMMPGMTGADIYRRAVLLDAKWSRRFIFVTGAASTPAVAEFLNTLDVRVFHKPVATERLLETLRQMAESARR